MYSIHQRPQSRYRSDWLAVVNISIVHLALQKIENDMPLMLEKINIIMSPVLGEEK